LPRPEYDSLTATTDLFQQFVIAQFSEELREALAPFNGTWWFVGATEVSALGYSFFVE
jgi:hypothetical protein